MMSHKNHVYFGENEVKIYEKEDPYYNVNLEYRKNRKNNSRLYRIEQYFRKMYLLLNGEMLSFSDHLQQHFRIGYIQHISYRRGWIDRDEFLHIVTK